MISLKHSAPWLLALGILLRCVALNQPIVDAHLLRQTQTAAATQNMMQQGGFPLTANVPWLGDLDTRYLQELPIYNYLAMGLFPLTGKLDPCGKIVSVALWAFGFILLQGLWRRCLPQAAVFWANLVFVLGPLEVFFGQAFMPEMLVQVLGFGFLLATMRYSENPTLPRWIVCAGTGLLGLLVKTPEVSHLFFILAFLIAQREGLSAFRKLRYWIALAIALGALAAWSRYVDSVNSAHVPLWTPHNALREFIGTVQDRLRPKSWMMVVFYLTAFVLPGPAALAGAWGLRVAVRPPAARWLLLWLASLVLFFLIWFGNTAPKQSYYNLVAAGPLAGLFGLGAADLLRRPWASRWPRAAFAAFATLLAAFSAPGIVYLFQQDRQILAASTWIRDHVPAGRPVICQFNHRVDMMDYPYNAVPAYYSGRPVFIWTKALSEPNRKSALERSGIAVVTLPNPPPSGLLGRFRRLRGQENVAPASTNWLAANGFHRVGTEPGFEIYATDGMPSP